MYQTYLWPKTCKITSKSSDVAYLPLPNDGGCSFTYPVVKVGVPDERRPARKTVWPVNTRRVICRSQIDLYGVINPQKHTWGYCFGGIRRRLKHNYIPSSRATTRVSCQKSSSHVMIRLHVGIKEPPFWQRVSDTQPINQINTYNMDLIRINLKRKYHTWLLVSYWPETSKRSLQR